MSESASLQPNDDEFTLQLPSGSTISIPIATPSSVRVVRRAAARELGCVDPCLVTLLSATGSILDDSETVTSCGVLQVTQSSVLFNIQHVSLEQIQPEATSTDPVSCLALARKGCRSYQSLSGHVSGEIRAWRDILAGGGCTLPESCEAAVTALHMIHQGTVDYFLSGDARGWIRLWKFYSEGSDPIGEVIQEMDDDGIAEIVSFATSADNRHILALDVTGMCVLFNTLMDVKYRFVDFTGAGCGAPYSSIAFLNSPSATIASPKRMEDIRMSGAVQPPHIVQVCLQTAKRLLAYDACFQPSDEVKKVVLSAGQELIASHVIRFGKATCMVHRTVDAGLLFELSASDEVIDCAFCGMLLVVLTATQIQVWHAGDQIAQESILAADGAVFVSLSVGVGCMDVPRAGTLCARTSAGSVMILCVAPMALARSGVGSEDVSDAEPHGGDLDLYAAGLEKWYNAM